MDWPPAIVVAPLVASAIPGAVAIAVAAINMKYQATLERSRQAFQAEQERLKAQRSLRDARLARLRAAYAVLIGMAYTAQQHTAGLVFLFGDETLVGKMSRMYDELESMGERVGEAITTLRLEQSGQVMIDQANGILSRLFHIAQLMHERDRNKASVKVPDVGAEIDQLIREVKQLEKMASAALQELEQSV